MTERESEIFKKVRELLIESFHPKSIILFGSRAKENNIAGSDFDFAIDIENKPGKEKLFSLQEQLDKISGLYKVDIVFLSEVDEEFKQIILETGKVIYEKGS